MPGFYGNQWFDITRFFIAALVSGFLLETVYERWTESSQGNSTAFYVCLLFLLPYLHHYFSNNPVIQIAGAIVMIFVVGIAHSQREWQFQSWYECRILNTLAIPAVSIAISTLVHASRPLWIIYCNSYASWELPIYYSLIVPIGASSLVFSILDSKSWKQILVFGLVTIYGTLWWNCIVKPFWNYLYVIKKSKGSGLKKSRKIKGVRLK